jgi:thiosulfate reductase cytochrome b subunit
MFSFVVPVSDDLGQIVRCDFGIVGGVLPDQRPPRRWPVLLLLIPVALVGAVMVILLARGLRELPQVQSFILDYPGPSTIPEWTPPGLPAWIGWQHFLNTLFLLLIVRSGWRMRTVLRPEGHWMRRNTLLRTKSRPRRISLDLWWHLAVDILWVANGVVFVVLLILTGQWARVVPTHWDVIPNAMSVAIQYASFEWPTENSWVNYNALQLLTYFLTIFIAAPLAVITGIRLSPWWIGPLTRLDRFYPARWAKRLHYPTMLYFVGFVVVHLTLVFATAALRNLNHMWASRDETSWWGAGIFTLALVVMVIAWITAKRFMLGAAKLTGDVVIRPAP